mmetsp:Transcript_3470/g.7564  ORF Transcript_3470/g.7564 Transcript_3470/m.7564 type:complete len:710 (-) Transcript_3470:1192-3321(-)|eukprot:CAMPEP_0202900714 /NCGR_PEP_ID=MMETSP1392-20130828/11996_1 /ASSEMBLY_ACC=CAM_ASM_000868 /TAXON_ID=225041 /ORGANISM="Chlamydomonas chlamydogama, Strain SAG 11-48b" /LENGTH=709 /DNA_ID=CAMNT_0049587155 /DNA_START=292 /DNA_END=2421 /DNA_ORIENTATION=+
MAYSVTPPSSSFVASQPQAVRNQSLKRITARSSLTPRLSTSGSLVTGESWVEKGAFQLSLSSSIRRSVASSPTESLPSASVPSVHYSSPAQGTVVVGFEVASTSKTTTRSISSKPSRQNGLGLLSKALTTDRIDINDAALPLLPSLPESSILTGFHQANNSLFFPNVDLTLLHGAQERHNVFKTELVSNAYMIAAHALEGHMRKDGTSLLSHCVLTALTLADLGLDAETVAGGLLHEVLRCNESFRSLLEEFMPKEVVQLVDRVTAISEISQLYRNHRDSLNDEKLRRMLLAMEDVKAVLVKLACRVHNMKTISALPREKQLCLAQETLEIFSVVANRLGVWCLKAELEDLAFSVLHPEEYEQLREQVQPRQDPAMLEATIQAIKAGMDQAGVPYEDISGRPKNLYGIWQKMKKDGHTSLDQVFDVMALRVVVSNKHDCYRALRAVQSVYRCMPGRSKDYIKDIKKPNGYQSLHETIYAEGSVPIEVQIRTHKMHYIAEYGFAAHWKYKENLNDDDEWLDKEVQYKKWLMNYKLGVHDKKVRPNGSPPTDSSLKSLGMHLLDGVQPGDQTKVDPFLRHDRFKLQQPSKSTVSVVVHTQDSVDAKEYPSGITAGQLIEELGVDNLPGYALTVNQKVPAGGLALQSGDLIQVVPLSHILSRSPGQGRLSRSVPDRYSQQLDVFLPGQSAPMTMQLGRAPQGSARAMPLHRQ